LSDLFFLRARRKDFAVCRRSRSGKALAYPSDYPHERPTLEEFLGDIPRFRARKDLSDGVKKLILRDNCVDFYSLAILAC